jgi:hypothetical protein
MYAQQVGTFTVVRGAVCLLLVTAPAYISVGIGMILGQVADRTEAVIPGATVTATNNVDGGRNHY